MTLDDLDLEFDYAGIESYITYLWSPSPNTLLKSIKKVEPGTYLIVHAGRVIDTGSFSTIEYRENISLNVDDKER